MKNIDSTKEKLPLDNSEENEFMTAYKLLFVFILCLGSYLVYITYMQRMASDHGNYFIARYSGVVSGAKGSKSLSYYFKVNNKVQKFSIGFYAPFKHDILLKALIALIDNPKYPVIYKYEEIPKCINFESVPKFGWESLPDCY